MVAERNSTNHGNYVQDPSSMRPDSFQMHQDAQRQAEERRRAAAAARQGRADWIRKAQIGLEVDKSIDDVTRMEVLQRVSQLDPNSNAGFAEIASLLTTAREGKGIYAIRRLNQNVRELKADMPGRAQLTLGTRSLI